MEAISNIIAPLLRVFPGGEEADIAQRVLRFVVDHSTTTHIDLQLVRQIVPEAAAGAYDRQILRTLQYLAGDAAKALEVRFEMIRSDDDIIQLEPTDVQEIRQHLVDPVSGEEDPTILERIIIYFSPTDLFLQMIIEEHARDEGAKS